MFSRRVRKVHLRTPYLQNELSFQGERPAPQMFLLVINTRGSQPVPYIWLIAESFQGLFPTALVKVQHSSNFTGSVLLPAMTAPVVASVV